MKRSPFKVKRPPPWVKPERAPIAHKPLTRPVNMPLCDGMAPRIDKEAIVYSEPYRRLVAALPCIACQIEGYSQAAHPPPTAKGRKEDDRKCFPLCCIHPCATGTSLIDGCHIDFDRYTVISRERANEAALRYGAITRHAIRESGQWPKGLPHMEEQTELELA